MTTNPGPLPDGPVAAPTVAAPQASAPAPGERATKDSLLDAAELLFVEHGIAATSLRAITQQAGANLASVHYHFGSKEALIQAVLDRRLRPLNAERLRLLDAAEEAAGKRAPALEAVIAAFVQPAFALAEGRASTFARMLGRVHFDSDQRILDLVYRTFEEVFLRFNAALARACPHLDERAVLRRFYFSVGAMAIAVANAERDETLRTGFPFDAAAWRDELVAFVVAAFRAPARPASVPRSRPPQEPA